MLSSASHTIASVIDRHAVHRPDQPAFVGSDFAPFSFQELSLKIRQIGQLLQVAGIGSSSRVGIVLPDGPEAAVLSVSIASHAVSVPFNPNLTAPELAEELKLAEIDALVVPSWIELPALAIAENTPLGVFQASKAGHCLSSIALRQMRRVPAARQKFGSASANSLAIINKSSGTTDTPKLIPVTHTNLLATANKTQSCLGLSSEDRCACIVPLYHGLGLRIAVLAPLLLGGSVALPTNRQAENFAIWLSDLCPTWLPATPTFLEAVLGRLRSGTRKKLEHCLRFIMTTASYLPDAVRAELEAILRIPILEVYGSSECGLIAADPAPPGKRKPGTVGQFTPDELAIKGPKDDLLAIGEIGEIVVRGPTVMPGYLNEDYDGASGFHEKWLATGDLGFVDAEGFLTLVGRTKELINRGGEKISPYDVERALLEHPSVREAAAFAVPHPRLGENVAAGVVLKSETTVTPEELRAYLVGRLAYSKVPQHVFILESLPKGEMGKTLRSKLPEVVKNYERTIVEPGLTLEHQIAEIWQKLLGRNDIGVEDNFFEAGGDSLLAVEMLLQVEAITRQSVPQSALREAYTIRQLANAVMRASPSQREAITCARQGSGTPFFYCHGDFEGRGFYALKLADSLGLDQPVFLLHPELKPIGSAKLEKMAQAYLPEILAIHPRGRFRLGGFCNGGLLAWEIAHQLRKVGREVEIVVLIDTLSINSRRAPRAVGRSVRILPNLLPLSASEKVIRHGMVAVWSLFNWYGSANWKDTGIIDPTLQKIERTLHEQLGESGSQNDTPTSAYFRIMSNYIPPKIDSAVLCLVSEKNSRSYRFSPVPWGLLAKSVHCETLPGEHLTCITTYVEELANALRRQFLGGRN